MTSKNTENINENIRHERIFVDIYNYIIFAIIIIDLHEGFPS